MGMAHSRNRLIIRYMWFSVFLVWSDVAIAILRIATAAILIAHGLPKAKNFSGTASWFESVGFKPGKLWVGVVVALECGGGILLLAGFLVQPIAILLAIQFAVILFWRLRRGDKLIGGYELDLIIFASLLALVTLGSGAFAFDNLAPYLF